VSRADALYALASEVLPGGVCASARANSAIGHPFYVSRGDGAILYDLDGRPYVDMCTSHGASLLGHNHPGVKAAMQAALDIGVDIVNDIRALRAHGAIELIASHRACGVCLMHMRSDPQTMQDATDYDDVVDEVGSFLAARADAAIGHGIAKERIVLDPGIGFGKRAEHNLALLARQRELLALGYPLLLGWSRKSTLGALTGRAVQDRLAASLAAALAAVQEGASIVRVHDVAATVDALRVWRAAGLGARPATLALHNPGASSDAPQRSETT